MRCVPHQTIGSYLARRPTFPFGHQLTLGTRSKNRHRRAVEGQLSGKEIERRLGSTRPEPPLPRVG
jgi:hypothetical protein